MARKFQNRYKPDYVTAPGETLAESLEALEMKLSDLAQKTGENQTTVEAILRGEAPLTPEFALKLEEVIGVPADFWNRYERRWREYLANLIHPLTAMKLMLQSRVTITISTLRITCLMIAIMWS